MPILTSLFFGFIPMLICAYFIYWLDRYEKEPVQLLGFVFIWGAIVASTAAFIINTFLGVGFYLFTASETLTDFATGAFFAPPVEEVLKGLAVFLVFLVFHHEFDSILDGIIYAAIAALGFAATENAFYIYSMGYLENGWEGLFTLVFFRVIVVAWQHPFYTAFFGIGLGLARTAKSEWVRWTAPLAGLCIAVLLHSLHNAISSIGNAFVCILGSMLDWSGWIAMLIFILIIVERERKMIASQLESEIGISISQKLYDSITSHRLRSQAIFHSISQGTFKKTRHIFQLCAELAHKKHQSTFTNEPPKTHETVHLLRLKIKELTAIAPDLIH